MTEDASQDVEVKPEWAAAYAALQKHGNQKAACKALRCSVHTLRAHLQAYARVTGAALRPARGGRGKGLTAAHRDAWEAVRRLQSQKAAAAELGVHPNTVRQRLAEYRRHSGLPHGALPAPVEGWTAPDPCKPKPPTIDQRLDALLSALEAAQANGDDDQVHTLRAAIHRIERRVYGRGFEPLPAVVKRALKEQGPA